jgi:hypothetical protein
MGLAEQARYGKAARAARPRFNPKSTIISSEDRLLAWKVALLSKPRPRTIRWIQSLSDTQFGLIITKLVKANLPLEIASDPELICSAKLKHLLNLQN